MLKKNWSDRRKDAVAGGIDKFANEWSFARLGAVLIRL